MLTAGIAGLLSGALSMAAGEYVSVTSQKELLAASTPDPDTRTAVPKLDVERNELELVYRARGLDPEAAKEKAAAVFAEIAELEGLQELRDGAELEEELNTDVTGGDIHTGAVVEAEEETGSGMSAAISSFLCFGAGALVPVLPLFFGMTGLSAIVVAVVLVGVVLMITGGLVGMLSGVSPWLRALRQLAIGVGAAAATFALGSMFDAVG